MKRREFIQTTTAGGPYKLRTIMERQEEITP